LDKKVDGREKRWRFLVFAKGQAMSSNIGKKVQIQHENRALGKRKTGRARTALRGRQSYLKELSTQSTGKKKKEVPWLGGKEKNHSGESDGKEGGSRGETKGSSSARKQEKNGTIPLVPERV